MYAKVTTIQERRKVVRVRERKKLGLVHILKQIQQTDCAQPEDIIISIFKVKTFGISVILENHTNKIVLFTY